jgi:nucleoside-diphosphate-sugar epimerase
MAAEQAECKVLVLGGVGFIGRNFVKYLVVRVFSLSVWPILMSSLKRSVTLAVPCL